MDKLLGSAISSELIFVYGLIALVIILIAVIIIIDRKESKKKPQSLFDTLNMKIIADPGSTIEKLEDQQESLPLETIEIKQETKETDFQDLEPLPEVKTVVSSNFTETSNDKDLISSGISFEEDAYKESDLEKTQAQIRVEEITKALQNAQIEEKIEEDKYAKFEEEQEKNAIISYNELKESFDRLYSENEKIQYLEDDEIPINIDELYQLSNHQEEKKKIESPKVKLEDLSDFTTTKTENKTNSTFKSSPLISPVYGIQEPPVQVTQTVDKEIENANQFLQSLKELKNNLD